MERTKKRLLSMTYNEIRNLCKANGLGARGKKIDLIDSLSETIVLDDSLVEEMEQSANTEFVDKGGNQVVVQEDKENDVEMEQDEPMNISNETVTIEVPDDGKPAPGVPNLDITDDMPLSETIVAGSMITSELTKTTVIQEPEASITTRPKRQLPKPGFSGADRFAASHNKNFAKMESISDRQMKIDARLNEYNDSITERLSRLATPKHQKEKIRRFASPSPANLKFGNVAPEQIETVQKPYKPEEAEANRRILRTRPQRETEKDVKQLTMKSKIPKPKFIPSTRPHCTERLEQLATPKSAGRIEIPKERKSYTPKTTPYKYVDTTKMSNAELREHDLRQKRNLRPLKF